MRTLRLCVKPSGEAAVLQFWRIQTVALVCMTLLFCEDLLFSVLLTLKFVSAREDFFLLVTGHLSLAATLVAAKGRAVSSVAGKRMNTEVTESLRGLCVEGLKAQRTRRSSFWVRLPGRAAPLPAVVQACVVASNLLWFARRAVLPQVWWMDAHRKRGKRRRRRLQRTAFAEHIAQKRLKWWGMRILPCLGGESSR